MTLRRNTRRELEHRRALICENDLLIPRAHIIQGELSRFGTRDKLSQPGPAVSPHCIDDLIFVGSRHRRSEKDSGNWNCYPKHSLTVSEQSPLLLVSPLRFLVGKSPTKLPSHSGSQSANDTGRAALFRIIHFPKSTLRNVHVGQVEFQHHPASPLGISSPHAAIVRTLRKANHSPSLDSDFLPTKNLCLDIYFSKNGFRQRLQRTRLRFPRVLV